MSNVSFLFNLLIALAVLGVPAFCQTITTVAGNGSVGNSGDGGPATSASIGEPHGVVVDQAGNIYIADCIFNFIRKVDTAGIISTFAGGNWSTWATAAPPPTPDSISDPLPMPASLSTRPGIYISRIPATCASAKWTPPLE